MVEMLLRHWKSSSQGLDIDQSWHNILETTWRRNRDFQVSARNSLEVIKLFLEYGANPEAICLMARYSAISIIETALRTHHPLDEDKIRALLMRHLPSPADISVAEPLGEASQSRADVEQEITQERLKQSLLPIRKRFLLGTSKIAIGKG
jgi:hypothetical protein